VLSLAFVLLVILPVIFAFGFFFLLPLVPSGPYPDALSKGFQYTLAIEPHGDLQNATFYLPLPVKNGKPMLGNKSVVPEDFEKEGFSIAFTRSPPLLNQSVIYGKEPFFANDEPCFVRIHADPWPNETYRVELRDNAYDLQSPSQFMSTLYPVGNESITLPKFSFSPPNPAGQVIPRQGSGLKRYTNTSSTQYTWIYVDLTGEYVRPPGTMDSASVFLRIHAYNQWLDGYDEWRYNYYEDYFSDSVVAPSHGGSFITGKFQAGEGEYPDLSTDRWQQFIRKNESVSEK